MYMFAGPAAGTGQILCPHFRPDGTIARGVAKYMTSTETEPGQAESKEEETTNFLLCPINWRAWTTATVPHAQYLYQRVGEQDNPFQVQEDLKAAHAFMMELQAKQKQEGGGGGQPGDEVAGDVSEGQGHPGHGGPPVSQPAPPAAKPEPEKSDEELADTDKSGDVSKSEKKAFEQANPGKTVKKGPISK